MLEKCNDLLFQWQFRWFWELEITSSSLGALGSTARTGFCLCCPRSISIWITRC